MRVCEKESEYTVSIDAAEYAVGVEQRMARLQQFVVDTAVHKERAVFARQFGEEAERIEVLAALTKRNEPRRTTALRLHVQ